MTGVNLNRRVSGQQPAGVCWLWTKKWSVVSQAQLQLTPVVMDHRCWRQWNKTQQQKKVNNTNSHCHTPEQVQSPHNTPESSSHSGKGLKLTGGAVGETVTGRQAPQWYSHYIRYHDIVLRRTSHDLTSGNVSSVEATVTLSCCVKD